MTVLLSPPMYLQFQNPNNSGAPAAGFLLFTYVAGTSTKQATWTDSTQSVQNANPIVLDSNGAAYVWLDSTLTYKYVLSPPNDTDPPTSPIRSEDNITAGVNSLAIAYSRTAAEIAAAVTPVNFSYPTTNFLDPRRYGAVIDGVTDDTIALQNWLTVLGQPSQRAVGYLPEGTYKYSANLTVPANVNIQGAGNQQTILKPTVAVTAALTTGAGVKLHAFMIDGTNTTNAVGLTVGPVGPDYNEIVDIWVQNFLGSGANNGIGILVQNVVSFLGLRLFAVGCNVGLQVSSPTPASLPTTTLFLSCRFRTSVTNSGAAPSGIGAWIVSGQQITFRDCVFEVNTQQGVFIQAPGGGIVQDLSIEDSWFEDNWHGYAISSAITFTASVGGASSGTLNANWGGPTGVYSVTFSDGEVRKVTLTNGATTATWSPALSAGTITTATVNVYALHVDGTTGSGANVTLSGLHMTSGSSLTARKNILLASCLARLSRIRSFFGFAHDIVVTGGGAALVYVTDDPYDRCGRFIDSGNAVGQVLYPPYLPIMDLGTGLSVLPIVEKLVALTYSASITPDLQNGTSFTINVSNTTAFTINAPLNSANVQVGKRMSVRINNVSGNNVLGAVTWNAVFKLAAWTQPQNNFYNSIEFEWDGANFREMNRTTTQVAV